MASYFVSSASGAGGAGNGSSWANAYLTIVAAIARPLAAGDTLLVGDDHAESTAANNVLNFTTSTEAAPCNILVVDHTKSSPSIPADLKVGVSGAGSIITTTVGNIQYAGFLYVYGLYTAAGMSSTANNVGVFMPQSGKASIFERCTFVIGATGTNALINVNTSTYCEFRNCTFSFVNSASQSMSAIATVRFTGCTWTFSGTQPTRLFLSGSNQILFFEGCDFSAATCLLIGTLGSGANKITFKDCKLPTTTPLFDMTTSAALPQTSQVWVVNSDNANTNYRNELYDSTGTLLTSLTVVRTGGASMGTPYSWNISTTSLTNWIFNFKSLPISIWNNTTGAAINVTVEGIADPRYFSALPNNDEVWIDVEALASASQPAGVTYFGTKTSPLGTNAALTASTSAWDSAATARANSTSYNLGDIFKVSSNPGRLFLCTTAGITSSSQPGIPYSSAIDGTAVTDGTAIFTAMWRFKQTITTGTIQFAGPISIYPKVGKVSIAGVYIDPIAILS